MTLTLEIPDSVSEKLSDVSNECLEKQALEGIAANGYAEGKLSLKQVRIMLNLEDRWEAEALLSKYGVWPGTTVEDLKSDMATLDKFLARKKQCLS